MKKWIFNSVQVIFWVLVLFSFSYAFEWMQMEEMNEPRASFAAAVSEGKIYVMGGLNGQYGAYSSTAEVYDPVANQWAPLPNMNSNRTYGMAQAFEGKVYIFGGKTSGGGQLPLSRNMILSLMNGITNLHFCSRGGWELQLY
jgi:N-acetylneuraminic acid mutarotase